MLEDQRYFEVDPQSSPSRYTLQFDKLVDPRINHPPSPWDIYKSKLHSKSKMEDPGSREISLNAVREYLFSARLNHRIIRLGSQLPHRQFLILRCKGSGMGRTL